MATKIKTTNHNNTKSGSILAYSLIILAMMMAIAASLSITTLSSKKNASSTEFSSQSLQIADSGAQLTLKKINSNLTKAINGPLSPFASSVCDDLTGTVTGLTDAGQGTYNITFFASADMLTPSHCADPLNTVKSIKSVATYKNTTRSVSVVVAINGNDSFVKLLLHADNAGSNVFVDSSKTPKPSITGSGNAIQSAAFSQFSSASSLLIPDSTSYLQLPASTDFDISSGPWTMDAWIYPTGDFIAGTDNMNIFNDGHVNFPNRWVWDFTLSDIRYASKDNTIVWTVPATINKNSWNHVAMVSDGTKAYMYVNGVRVDDKTQAAFNPAYFGTPSIAYQSRPNAVDSTNKYYIDEFRFSKGTARWTSDTFVPPATPY